MAIVSEATPSPDPSLAVSRDPRPRPPPRPVIRLKCTYTSNKKLVSLHDLDDATLARILLLAVTVDEAHFPSTLHPSIVDVLPRGYVGRVCRGWHERLKRLPQAWQTVVALTDGIPIITASRDIYPLTTYARLSLNLPLTVIISRRRKDPFLLDERAAITVPAIMKTLEPLSYRIEGLFVYTNQSSSLPVFQDLVAPPNRWPALKKVSFRCHADDSSFHNTDAQASHASSFPSYPLTHRTSFNKGSNLVHLALDGYNVMKMFSSVATESLFNQATANLKILSISHLTPRVMGYSHSAVLRLLAIVVSIGHLRTLTFEWLELCDTEEGHLSHQAPLLLSSIETLHVKLADPASIGLLLRWVAPRKLHLESCYLSMSLAPLVPFPGCISSLKLTNVCEGPDVLAMLLRWEGAELEIVSSEFLSDAFLKDLKTRFSEGKRPMMVGLKRLRIVECNDFTVPGTLIEALEARRGNNMLLQVPSPGPSTISSSGNTPMMRAKRAFLASILDDLVVVGGNESSLRTGNASGGGNWALRAAALTRCLKWNV